MLQEIEWIVAVTNLSYYVIASSSPNIQFSLKMDKGTFFHLGL